MRAPRSYSVGGAFSTSAWAIAPNWVRAPVAVTDAWPMPLTIDVPANSWPSGPSPTCFSTGSDSPVSAA